MIVHAIFLHSYHNHDGLHLTYSPFNAHSWYEGYPKIDILPSICHKTCTTDTPDDWVIAHLGYWEEQSDPNRLVSIIKRNDDTRYTINFQRGQSMVGTAYTMRREYKSIFSILLFYRFIEGFKDSEWREMRMKKTPSEAKVIRKRWTTHFIV